MKKPADRRPVTKGVLSRSLKILFRAYPVLMTVVVVCLVFSAVTAAIPSIFLQKVLAIIEVYFRSIPNARITCPYISLPNSRHP